MGLSGRICVALTRRAGGGEGGAREALTPDSLFTLRLDLALVLLNELLRLRTDFPYFGLPDGADSVSKDDLPLSNATQSN